MTNMTDAAREAQREYMEQWRAKNKDRVRANTQRYWERRAAERKEQMDSAKTKDQP